MITNADLIGLSQEDEDRLLDIDGEIMRRREEIVAWHRLLDRRRLDRKTGLHPIVEFAMGAAPEGDEQGRLVRRGGRDEREDEPAPEREPFYISTEHEARAVLVHGLGYLTDAEGNRLAFDKGEGDRDKAAAWILREISETSALAYIRKRSPCIFGIPLAVTNS